MCSEGDLLRVSEIIVTSKEEAGNKAETLLLDLNRCKRHYLTQHNLYRGTKTSLTFERTQRSYGQAFLVLLNFLSRFCMLIETRTEFQFYFL